MKVEHVEHKRVKSKTKVCEDRACKNTKGSDVKVDYVGGQSLKVKVKHVKEKNSNWKVDAHLQNLDGIIEIGIEFIDKFYNEKFKQFFELSLDPTISCPTL